MSKHYEEKTVKEEIKVLPCIKCGGEDIELGDCGYSSFNVAWGECRDCGHKVKIQPCGCDISKRKIAERWNIENDPHILHAKYLKQINKLKEKIEELPL